MIKEYAVPTNTLIISKDAFTRLLIARFKITKSSAIKLKDGGAAMLDINTKNHIRGVETLQPKTPLVSKMLRE